MTWPKSVIVTGASSGIGGSTARLLHAAGAHPVLAARRAGRVAALSEELNRALTVPTGVTDLVQVRDLVAAALGPHQRIDGLVNNAGASLHAPARPGRPRRVRTGPAAQPRPAIRR